MGPTLKVGSVGRAVQVAKRAVGDWNGKPPAHPTPVFGVFFRQLVKQFQKAHQIPQTGVVGPRTWQALEPYLPKPPAPAWTQIGPVHARGRSVLDQDLTHATSGIPLYPAFDDAFREGLSIIAPEPLTVTVNPRTGAGFSSSNPGRAFYCIGQSRIRYWFGHLDRNHPPGITFRKGQLIGKTCRNTVGGGPHVHVGVNVELLWGAGQQLEHKTSYQHGAPTVRTQLAGRTA